MRHDALPMQTDELARESDVAVVDPLTSYELADAWGTPRFGKRLLDLAASHASVEEVFLWERHRGQAPRMLAAASRLADQDSRVASYSDRFFISDPLMEPFGRSGFFMRIVGSEEISFAEYRRICFDQPHFDQKMSFFMRDMDRIIAVNFYLGKERGDADTTSIRLASLASLAISTHLRHATSGETHLVVARLEARLHARFRELTTKECAVLARCALAMPPRAIAKSLAIKTASVKTYRMRALSKLGHVELSEILAQVID